MRSPLPATITSPTNPQKKYYELTILSAKRIEFGVRTAEKTMLAMRTVQSSGHDDIQLMLNLKRKEIDIQFSLRIPPHKKMCKFRFRLPISLISQMYKTTDTAGQPSLVIPFNSPPCFYMQKNEGEDLGNGQKHTSFTGSDKIWSEWDTWYRVTDIVDDAIQKTLRYNPLMNHRNTAMIDIGKYTCWFQ
jgi:RNA-dependent RNA polymerase